MEAENKKQQSGRAAPRRSRADKLGRADWIDAGLELLAEKGIDAVAVEPLCERLGVTKGSFYWHFADRPALHTAMLEVWQETGTGEIIRQVEGLQGGPREKLEHVFGVLRASRRADLEAALRSWAARDASVAAAIRGVDHERITFVASILAGLGFSHNDALRRSRLIYLVLIGSFVAGTYGQNLGTPDVWDLLEAVLTQRPDTASAPSHPS